MKKLIGIMLCLVLLSAGVFAVDLAIISGARGGLALGIMIDQETAGEIGARYGIELTDGLKPTILFVGSKFYLSEVNDCPVNLATGLVGYLGNGDSNTGISLGIVLDKVFGISQLSVETGIDALANDGKVQVQAIYEL